MAERTIKTVRIVPGSALEALSRARSFTELVHELADNYVRNTYGLPIQPKPSGVLGVEDLSDLA